VNKKADQIAIPSVTAALNLHQISTKNAPHQPTPNNMPAITTTAIQSASLYFREGNSDKEYRAAIEPKGDGFVVNFAYGRRGGTLNTGTKTPVPVPEAEAIKAFEKLIASKVAKGYRPIANTNAHYPLTGSEGIDSGVRCQLLNAVEESDVSRLLTDTRYCLQEKHDGRRLMVRKQDHEITGINRRGLVVAIPEPIRSAVATIPGNCLIDGEAVGDTLHAFDLLELNGGDLRQRRYLDRYSGLLALIPLNQPALRCVSTIIAPNDKAELYDQLRLANREGVVFKDMNASFTAGRPNSGGPQLKFKFVESASFVVTGVNAKRSVMLGLYDGDKLVPAGNVTIPPNHAIPLKGTVAECRYLYAHKQSGFIYQPVYLGPRTDIPLSECGVDQLKYKAESEATVAD
jgi:bifunctional non-homologous end joining protein LigD